MVQPALAAEPVRSALPGLKGKNVLVTGAGLSEDVARHHVDMTRAFNEGRVHSTLGREAVAARKPHCSSTSSKPNSEASARRGRYARFQPK
jgi:hypothetical protein